MATQTQTNAPANAPQAGATVKGGKKVRISDVEAKMKEIVEKLKILDQLLSTTEEPDRHDVDGDVIVLTGKLPQVDEYFHAIEIPRWRIEDNEIVLSQPLTISEIKLDENGVTVLATQYPDAKTVFLLTLAELWNGAVSHTLDEITQVVRSYVKLTKI